MTILNRFYSENIYLKSIEVCICRTHLSYIIYSTVYCIHIEYSIHCTLYTCSMHVLIMKLILQTLFLITKLNLLSVQKTVLETVFLTTIYQAIVETTKFFRGLYLDICLQHFLKVAPTQRILRKSLFQMQK